MMASLVRAVPRVLCRSQQSLTGLTALQSLTPRSLPISQRSFFSSSSYSWPSIALIRHNHQSPINYFASKSQRYYASGAEITIAVPGMGDSISEGTVLEWTKNEGDSCRVDDVVCILETDKIRVDVRAPEEGIVVRHLAGIGDDVRVGQDLFVMTPGAAKADSAKPASKPAEATSKPAEPVAKPSEPAPKSSAATMAAPPQKAPSPTPSPSAPAPKPSTPVQNTPAAVSNQTATRGERKVKMSKMRQRIAHRLKESQDTAAMLTTFNEVDMFNLIALRNKHKEAFEKKHGIKLGFMAPFVKAVSSALRDFPIVNAVIDSDGESIIYRDYHDISVAVAAPSGLVVPVLRNVESMSLAQIETQIAAYGKKAKEGTLAIEEMTGGTFTISNGGTYGSLFGTPIINPPQSAILGMHASKDRPYVVDGEVKVRPVMYIALTYDHRLIDGREAVLTLKKIKSVIEEPELLLLDL